MPLPNHYATLGVKPTATREEISAAFRRSASDCHPDRPHDVDDGAERYKELSAAYSVLKNEDTRAAYDRERRLLAKPCEACEGTGYTEEQRGFHARVQTTCERCGGTGERA